MRIVVVLIVTLASMCVVETNILVTPPPAVTDSLQAVAIGIADSLATHHGLRKYVFNEGCNVEGDAGKWLSEWRASGGPSFRICAELNEPWRLRLHMQDAAFSRNSREEALETELVAVLRSRFGDEAVRVSH